MTTTDASKGTRERFEDQVGSVPCDCGLEGCTKRLYDPADILEFIESERALAVSEARRRDAAYFREVASMDPKTEFAAGYHDGMLDAADRLEGEAGRGEN